MNIFETDDYPNNNSKELTNELIKYHNLVYDTQLNPQESVSIDVGLFSRSFLTRLLRIFNYYRGNIALPHQIDKDLRLKILNDIKNIRNNISSSTFVFDHNRHIYKGRARIGEMLKPYVRSRSDWPVERDEYIKFYQQIMAIYALSKGLYTTNGDNLERIWNKTPNQGFIATPNDLGNAWSDPLPDHSIMNKPLPNEGTFQFIWPARMNMNSLMKSHLEYLKSYFVQPLEIVIMNNGKSYQYMTRKEEYLYFNNKH